MRHLFILTLVVFFSIHSETQFEKLPNYFAANLSVQNGEFYKNFKAYCTIDKTLPDGYEWGVETEFERIVRILKDHSKGLFSLIGVGVAEGVYTYTEDIIKEKIKNDTDKTEARRAQSRYLAYPNNIAYSARFTLSLPGLCALYGVLYDYRYEKPQPVRRKKSEVKDTNQEVVKK
jgi:hypothetical protein